MSLHQKKSTRYYAEIPWRTTAMVIHNTRRLKIPLSRYLSLISRDPLEDHSDGNTQHTAIENPAFTLPISDKPLNHFLHQVEIKLGDKYHTSHARPFNKHHLHQVEIKLGDKYHTSHARPFNKHHHTITVRAGQEMENLLQALKEVINPTHIYFHNDNIERIFRQTFSRLFDDKVKIIKCNILCKNIEKTEDQEETVKEYHDRNHNGIIETYNQLKNKYYWPDMKSTINKYIKQESQWHHRNLQSIEK
ncbi:Integrase zinc binding domain [Popillia japonica]|uniref:Integrase zinc binding domain n=1 Tax=Popillia japonica TaxID=7064 RepID=A0AAW1IUW9_POPJA